MQRQEKGHESQSMFIVDRTVPGMTEELLEEVHRLLHESARRVSSAGQAVRYLRCTYLPEENRCLCLFEADNPAAVRRANETAPQSSTGIREPTRPRRGPGDGMPAERPEPLRRICQGHAWGKARSGSSGVTPESATS